MTRDSKENGGSDVQVWARVPFLGFRLEVFHRVFILSYSDISCAEV
jgi:hypothetical protein